MCHRDCGQRLCDFRFSDLRVLSPCPFFPSQDALINDSRRSCSDLDLSSKGAQMGLNLWRTTLPLKIRHEADQVLAVDVEPWFKTDRLRPRPRSTLKTDRFKTVRFKSDRPRSRRRRSVSNRRPERTNPKFTRTKHLCVCALRHRHPRSPSSPLRKTPFPRPQFLANCLLLPVNLNRLPVNLNRPPVRFLPNWPPLHR